MRHNIKDELRGVLTFVGVIWCVFLVDSALPVKLADYGVTPRSAIGLAGIPAMPFLHAGYEHLISNTVPLTILLMLLAGSRANSWLIVLGVVLLGGSLLWLFGRTATHVGASGLIYGLIAFLIVSGLLEKRLVPLGIAILVGFLFGGVLLSGVLPTAGERVSWDGHLCGAIGGVVIAYLLNRQPRQSALPLGEG